MLTVLTVFFYSGPICHKITVDVYRFEPGREGRQATIKGKKAGFPVFAPVTEGEFSRRK